MTSGEELFVSDRSEWGEIYKSLGGMMCLKMFFKTTVCAIDFDF